MGFFDRFRKPSTQLASTEQTFADSFRGQPVYYDIRRMAPAEMWETQPHLRTVVSFLARNIAQLGLHTFQRVGETDRVRDRASVAARVFRRPNSEMTAFELIFALVGDLALYDLAYWHVAQDSDAPSGWSIVRIPVEWVTPKNADAFRRASYDVKAPGGDKVNFPASEILAFHGFNPADPRDGSTAISALKGVLQEQLQSSMYRQQVWKNGGRVSAVLTRPPNAPAWSDEAKNRFRDDWYAAYAGNGPKAGGTPILDDGMTLQKVDFSAKEQEYVEGAKLSFATVCSAYHVNPTMVGLLDNANYSNVREFRRMLYGDTLGPIIAQIEDRLNTFLLPMLGMDDAEYYLEFNIAEKLQGSFEEQAAVMQTLVGAPIMTRNEGRAKFNLPNMGEAFDEPVTPLNVLIGGQASPTDSGSQNAAPKGLADTQRKILKAFEADFFKAQATDTQRDQVTRVLSRFFDRQGKAVLSAIGAGGEWWDGERWDKELSSDLMKVSHTLAALLGAKEAERLGYQDGYDPDMTVNFLKAVAADRAAGINATTKAQLDEQMAADEPDPAHVFDVATSDRAVSTGKSVAAFVAGFASVEAAKQISKREGTSPTKTWVTGPNPRTSHAAMDGETVPVDEPFSNGMTWTGQGGSEDAGCNCSTVINP